MKKSPNSSFAVALLLSGLGFTTVRAQDTVPTYVPKTLEEKAGFIIGHNFFNNLKAQGADVDVAALLQGIQAAARGGELPMASEEIVAVMQKFEERIIARQESMLKALAEENLASGQKYLEAHASQGGTTKLPSGLQYRILKHGTGVASPAPQDRVKVHYTGRFIDGQVFDSSDGSEPVEFAVSGLIRGMTEALLKMKVGDKWEVAIPANLAYGANAPAEIGPNQVLVFELELLEIIQR